MSTDIRTHLNFPWQTVPAGTAEPERACCQPVCRLPYLALLPRARRSRGRHVRTGQVPLRRRRAAVELEQKNLRRRTFREPPSGLDAEIKAKLRGRPAIFVLEEGAAAGYDSQPRRILQSERGGGGEGGREVRFLNASGGWEDIGKHHECFWKFHWRPIWRFIIHLRGSFLFKFRCPCPPVPLPPPRMPFSYWLSFPAW